MMQEVKLEFPILVYRDGDEWVAQSLLTCTTAVNKDHNAALKEVSHLLDVEIDEALADAQGDMNKAIQMIACPAPEHLWKEFFLASHPSASPPTPRRQRVDNAELRFSSRDAVSVAR